MSLEILGAFADSDLTMAGTLLDCRIGDECDLSAEFALMRLRQLQAEADAEQWLLRAIVRKADRLMIGHIGFHTTPSPDYLVGYAPGGVEIGYCVYEPFRRNGFAYEAASALMAWANSQHGVTDIVASIAPDNAASLALLQKLGSQWAVRHVGVYDDPVDGHEDVYLMRNR